MAEQQKKSKLETVKESSNFLRGTIGDELGRDTQKFSSDDAGLLKFHDTYQQDDRDARICHREGVEELLRFDAAYKSRAESRRAGTHA